MSDSASDESYVVTLRHGSDDDARAAFDAMYRAYYPQLWRFAYALTRHEDVAQDAVQELFLGIWRNRRTWDARQGVRAYLFGAVRHEAVRALARGNRAAGLDDLPTPTAAMGAEPHSPDADTIADDLAAALRRAVDALPERQRAALLLRWDAELNATDIGRALGISDRAAAKLLGKAQAYLRQVWERLAP
jgi:RNA polymerase sigma-70 factor (ECF subfamily)